MHLRLSIALGTPVVEDEAHQILGKVSGILLHPDTGQVVGFFVFVSSSLLSSAELFLQTSDILAWGTKVHVRNAEKLIPPGDIIRLESLLNSGRPILGQKIVTERKHSVLGVCKDVQFSTRTFMLEYLFPRGMFTSGIPVPASEVVRVTKASVIVREPVRKKKVPVQRAIEDEAPTAVLPDTIPAVSFKKRT